MNILQFHESKSSRDVISLFSGAMGFDIGLSIAGLNVRICQDIDTVCVNTIRANGNNVLAGDIREILPGQLLCLAGLGRGEPFLVCGGLPCQPFSTAGKRLGVDDPRGSLFTDFIRMIDYIRPRFFIMENVKGLISATLKPETCLGAKNQNSGARILELFFHEFEKLGYKTVYGLLDAVNYGVPQFRERFVLLGSRDGEDIFLPRPTHFQTHQNQAYQWQTLRSAIGDLEETPGPYTNFSQERIGYLQLVPEGGYWKNLPPGKIQQAMGGAYESGGGKVGFYRRISFDQPCPTLVTSPVQKASMLCHPTKDRPLSIKEYARVQQFPDNWIFTGNVASQYRQIGNAVPVGLALALGETLVSVATESFTIKTKRVRGTDVHNKIKNAIELGYSHAN
jgi:DNA (cytosine-5)-methyltransferase 1